MSEGKDCDSLKSPASNGDSVDIGLVNLGGSFERLHVNSTTSIEEVFPKDAKDVEKDGNRPTLSESSALSGSVGSLNTIGVDFPREDQEINSLEEFLETKEHSNWQAIKEVVTVEALCEGDADPIDKAFEVHKKLCQIAKTSTENTRAIKKLADRVEDFAYDLLDQLKHIEVEEFHDEAADRYASVFGEMTDNAIAKGQKKFVSHPFIFKRVEKRWKLGLSEEFRSQLPHRLLLLLIMILDAVLTPVLLPFTAYVAFRDQKGHFDEKIKNEKRSTLTKIQVIYRDYRGTPFVIFMKTQIMQLIFIGLFFRISLIGSYVAPSVEEGLILLFFCGFIQSEIQQYRSSPSRVYSRDEWNYLDLLIMLVYGFVFAIRIATMIIGGDPYKNRLLELANYGYGFDAMLLILRFSSILEFSSVIGPLQLALFQMCRDLLVILVQFGFFTVAFSLAITKCYTAETSFLTPLKNGSNNVEYCVEGSLDCFFKSARQLVWSMFGMTHFEEMESITSLTSDIVVFLYFIFLVLSVILLVNILVALLTTTIDKYKTNAEIEWKFYRAVVEEQYRRMHVVVFPFNIISEPLQALYFAVNPVKHRDQAKEKRTEKYKKFFQTKFFPVLKRRYKAKYNGFFPLTGDRKLDNLGGNLESVTKTMMNLEGKLNFIIEQITLQRISKGDPRESKGRSNKRVSFIEDDEETNSSSSANRELSNSMAGVQIRLTREAQAQEETENPITGTF